MHMSNGFKCLQALCLTLEKVDIVPLYQVFIMEYKSTDLEILTLIKEL